jgi:hypothetical protein
MSGRRGELRTTGLFVVTAVACAALLAFVPHRARTTPIPYAAVNGTVGMNWIVQYPNARPAPGASTYGLSTPPRAASGGATFSVTDTVRPTGAPGGTVCLSLVAVNAQSSAPAQRANTCIPLAPGWSRFPAVTLLTAAPSRVYAEITARGNADGFEARALNVGAAR